MDIEDYNKFLDSEEYKKVTDGYSKFIDRYVKKFNIMPTDPLYFNAYAEGYANGYQDGAIKTTKVVNEYLEELKREDE